MSRRRPSRLRRALVVVAGSAGLLVPFLFYVWGNVQIVSTGYQVETTEERLRSLEQRNRALRLEKARLEAPPRVEERARRLGLVPLAPGRLLVLARPGDPPPAPPPTPTPPPRDGDGGGAGSGRP